MRLIHVYINKKRVDSIYWRRGKLSLVLKTIMEHGLEVYSVKKIKSVEFKISRKVAL